MQEVGGSIPPGSTTLRKQRMAPQAKAAALKQLDHF
jgi:hypothetical protein